MSLSFICDQAELDKSLSLVARAVGGVVARRVALAGVLFQLQGDQLVMTGSDLSVTISAAVSVRGEADGAALLPGRLLQAIVSVLDDAPVAISVDGVFANIRAGTSEFRVRAMRHEDYPDLPHGNRSDFECEVECDGALLSDEFARVSRSACRDPNRGVLSGVLMESDDNALKLVSTDTYRLTVCRIDGHSILLGGRGSVILPAAAAVEFQRLFGRTTSVSVRMAQRFAQFEGGGVTLTGRLIAGQYPDYASIIPRGTVPAAKVSRWRLSLAIRRVRLLTLDEASIKIALQRNTLGLDASNPDVGSASDEMAVDYRGARVNEAFNPRHLSDGVESTPGESVELHFYGPQNPCLMRSSETDGFLYLLMPVAMS